MSRKFLLRKSVLVLAFTLSYSEKLTQFLYQQNFQILLDFTCATAKDELEKHPEMRTIAMVELESNFPSEFSREVLKCLPTDVTKVIINPHTHVTYKNASRLTKHSMVIYVADKIENIHQDLKLLLYYITHRIRTKYPLLHHLSKYLIVSRSEQDSKEMLQKLLNAVQIYEENQKVIAKSFNMTRNLTTFETFESSQRENLSQILFPDKTKHPNFNGKNFYTVYRTYVETTASFDEFDTPISKWTPYSRIVAEKLNATLKFIRINITIDEWQEHANELEGNGTLDIFLYYRPGKSFDLHSYDTMDWCFMAPVPDPYDITDLILFLPMDKSCWMWLGITIAVSTLIWRISEGHWGFVFGFFAYFMGQGQLIIRIRTHRLTMKILLQILIFVIFIFSNGYQSIITSFMLEPSKVPFLMTIDEVLDSDLNIQQFVAFKAQQRDNPKYQMMVKSGREIEFDEDIGEWWTRMREFQVAIPQPCKMNKFKQEFSGDGKSNQGIYLIPEVVTAVRYDIYTPQFYPYIDKLQELMDRTFEAGLHQAWEKFYFAQFREYHYEQYHRKQNFTVVDELDFGMIIPSFYILAIGFTAAAIALLCEYFWRDFVTQLSKEYCDRKWNEIAEKFRKFKRMKRAKGLERKIVQVKPAAKRRKSI